jgi:hypothetical protein
MLFRIEYSFLIRRIKIMNTIVKYAAKEAIQYIAKKVISTLIRKLKSRKK